MMRRLLAIACAATTTVGAFGCVVTAGESDWREGLSDDCAVGTVVLIGDEVRVDADGVMCDGFVLYDGSLGCLDVVEEVWGGAVSGVEGEFRLAIDDGCKVMVAAFGAHGASTSP